MIRVTQTIMGEQGNCFAACVASLLLPRQLRRSRPRMGHALTQLA